MTKTLVLCRHGHRDNSKRELDNGLDDKGREQAKSIKRFCEERFASEERGIWFVSSPKLRCVETLEPAAKVFDCKVDVHPELSEQGGKEAATGLENRVQLFLREWRESKAGLTVACSHGDWLPLTTFHLLGTAVDFKKGAWLEIEWLAGRAYLKWYIPSFKSFFK